MFLSRFQDCCVIVPGDANVGVNHGVFSSQKPPLLWEIEDDSHFLTDVA